jgi:hypothetical protein
MPLSIAGSLKPRADPSDVSALRETLVRIEPGAIP